MALSNYPLDLGAAVNDGTGDSLRDGGLKLNAVLGEAFNPKHPKFGAAGNGVANDLTAIQAAHDAAVAVKGKVYLPNGTYFLGNGATGLVLSGSVVFEGASSAGVILRYEGSGIAVSIHSDPTTEQVVFCRVTVDGNSLGATGIKIGSPPSFNAKLRLEDVRVRRFTTGISIAAMQGSIFDRVRVSECTNDGVLLDSGASVLITSSIFRSCYVHSNTARGWRILTAASCHWLGGVIETNGEEGIKFDNAAAGRVQGCSLRGVHFEQNNNGRGSGSFGQLLFTSSVSFMSRMEVRNCHFVTAGAGNFHVVPGSDNEVYLDQNFYDAGAPAGISKDETSRVRTNLRTVFDGTSLLKTAVVDGNGAVTVVDAEALFTNHGSATNLDGIVAAQNAFPDGSQVLIWFGDNNTTIRDGQFPATTNARSINLRGGANFKGRTNDFIVLAFRIADGVFREVYRSTDALPANSLAFSATRDLDLATIFGRGQFAIGNLTGNITFTVSNTRAGDRFMVLVRQDATGSRTVTWPAAFKVLTAVDATANLYTMWEFYFDGTNHWEISATAGLT